MANSETVVQKVEFKEANFKEVQKGMLSWFSFKMLLLTKLPMGLLNGMRVREINEEKCKVVVPYKWLNRNPFKSTFWAVLGMAAEFASGALVVMYTWKLKPSVAFMLVGTTATFHKKATGKTTFECIEGAKVKAAVERAAFSTEAEVIELPVKGYSKEGDLLCEFTFTWSIKARKKK